MNEEIFCVTWLDLLFEQFFTKEIASVDDSKFWCEQWKTSSELRLPIEGGGMMSGLLRSKQLSTR